MLTSFIFKWNKKGFQGSKVSAFSFSVFSNAFQANSSQNKIRIPWNNLVFSCTLKQPVHNRLNKAIDNFNLQLAIEKLLIEKNRKCPQQDSHYLANYLPSKYIKIMQILAGLTTLTCLLETQLKRQSVSHSTCDFIMRCEPTLKSNMFVFWLKFPRYSGMPGSLSICLCYYYHVS